MLDSSLLHVLSTVEKTGSFSKAAAELGVTQSAISQKIKILETKIGKSVVKRKGRQIELSSEGKRLTKIARTYYKKIDEFLVGLEHEKEEMVGELNIGTLNGVGKSWLSSKMIEFAKLYPNIQVNLCLEFPEKLIADFDREEYHALILPEYFAPVNSNSEYLHDEYSTLVYPKNSGLNISESMSAKEFSELPFIFFEKNDPLIQTWSKEKYGQAIRQISPKLVINAFGQILQAVSEGIGVAIVPIHVLKRSFYVDKINVLEGDFKVKNDTFNFIYSGDMSESKKISTLYDFLKQEVADFNP